MTYAAVTPYALMHYRSYGVSNMFRFHREKGVTVDNAGPWQVTTGSVTVWTISIEKKT